MWSGGDAGGDGLRGFGAEFWASDVRVGGVHPRRGRRGMEGRGMAVGLGNGYDSAVNGALACH